MNKSRVPFSLLCGEYVLASRARIEHCNAVFIFDFKEICDYTNKRKNSLILPDQDILTALYGDKVKVVDTLRYNLSDRILVVYNADLSHKKIDVSWVRENGVIIHYCGKNKPWKDNYVGTLGVFYQESKQCEQRAT